MASHSRTSDEGFPVFPAAKHRMYRELIFKPGSFSFTNPSGPWALVSDEGHMYFENAKGDVVPFDSVVVALGVEK